MANRTNLKGYFEAGDRPTTSQFGELIDNVVNVNDDKANDADIDAGISDVKYVTVLGSKRSARKSITVNGSSADLSTGNIFLPPSEVPLTFGEGLTRTVNSVSVNEEQKINKITNLAATNGYVKTSDLNGKLSVSSKIPASDLEGTIPNNVMKNTALITSNNEGFGYTTGNGGTQIQTVSKSSDVVLHALAGDITLDSTSILPSSSIVSFTLYNSKIAATDIIHLQHQKGATIGAFTLNAVSAAGSAKIYIRNNSNSNSTDSILDPIVIRFIVIKSSIT